jgi:hypothetical protein
VIAILAPPQPKWLSNVAFGGRAMDELYATSMDRLYRRKTKTPPRPPPPPPAPPAVARPRGGAAARGRPGGSGSSACYGDGRERAA